MLKMMMLAMTLVMMISHVRQGSTINAGLAMHMDSRGQVSGEAMTSIHEQ